MFKASWGPMNVRRRFLRGGRPVANEIGTPVPNTVNRRPQLFPLGGREPEQKYAFVQRKFGFLTEMGATVYRGLCPRTPAGGDPRTPLFFTVISATRLPLNGLKNRRFFCMLYIDQKQ